MNVPDSSKQNDCALVLDDGELKMAQTTLGFLYRKLASDFSERAAAEYLKWGFRSRKHEAERLGDALGRDYGSKYEAFFLPFVDSTQIANVKPLSEGASGAVWSADWARPHSDGLGLPPSVRIALKQPKNGVITERDKENFINEVSEAAKADLIHVTG
jgi:hypothetical protein